MPVPRSDDQTTRAAVAYLLTWITGLIVLLSSQREHAFARWHACQAIALGVALTLLMISLNIVSMTLRVLGRGIPFTDSPFLSLGMLVWPVALVLIIALAVQAKKGNTLRIPGLAAVADRMV